MRSAMKHYQREWISDTAWRYCPYRSRRLHDELPAHWDIWVLRTCPDCHAHLSMPGRISVDEKGRIYVKGFKCHRCGPIEWPTVYSSKSNFRHKEGSHALSAKGLGSGNLAPE